MAHEQNGEPLPTGYCWCGCGGRPRRGSFFLAGHDKRAVGAIVAAEYGGEARFLIKHGYGPGGKKPNEVFMRLQKEKAEKKERPTSDRGRGGRKLKNGGKNAAP